MDEIELTELGLPVGVPSTWKSFHPHSNCLLVAYGKIAMDGVCLSIYWRSLLKGKYEPLVAPGGYQFVNAPVISQANAGAYILLENPSTLDRSIGRLHFPEGRVSHGAPLAQPPQWTRCWLSELYGVGGQEDEVYVQIGTEPRMSDPKAIRHMTYRVALLRANTGQAVEIGPLATPFY